MAEDVQVPLAGPLPQKKLLIGAGVLAVAFVGWKYWQARQTSAGDASPIADGEFGAVDTSIPGVVGAVSPSNSYGGDTGSTDDGSAGSITTNSAWSAYAREQLNASYDDAEVLAALGNYLGSRPLSTAQQTIVRAAIAVAGYPPVGSFSVISGGDTTVSLAPADLRVQTAGATSLVLAWTPVAGADRYRLEYSDQVKTVTGASATVTGLTAGTSYTFRVYALNGAGTPGPAATLTAKTSAVQPSGYRGYGWWKADGKLDGTKIARKFNIKVTDLQKWNPSLGAKPAKGVWVKIRENSNPLTGYKG